MDGTLYKEAKDYWVLDESGNKYIDYILGFGPVVIGHSDSTYNEIMCQYIQNGIHFPGYSIYHEMVEELFKTDSFTDFVFFKSSSEAITASIRLACCYTNRKKIIRCGYIGWHDAALGKSVMWHEEVESRYRNTVLYEKHFRGIDGDESAVNWLDFDLDYLKEKAKSGEYAAFIIDAYQMHFCGKAVLDEAIKICQDNGVVVVVDETKTAGRIALRGITEKYSIDADLVVYGKAIANGAPLSILSGKKTIMNNSKEMRIGGTFGKELLGIYSSLATWKIIIDNGGYEKLASISYSTQNVMNDVFIRNNVIDKIRCDCVLEGGMLNFSMTDSLLNDMDKRIAIKRGFQNNGILLTEGHPFFVCLAHSQINTDRLEQMVDSACKFFCRYI